MTYAYETPSRLRPHTRSFLCKTALEQGFKAGCGNSHRPAPSAKYAAAGRAAVAMWSQPVAQVVA